MSYTIVINEEQRLALLKVISDLNIDLEGDDHPLQYWVDMLDDLPESEAEYPGFRHSFYEFYD